MYICENCGAICEDVPTYEEDFGYETGVGFRSACQTMDAECSCGGGFVEAVECEECGEWFAKNGNQTICDECLEKYKTVDNALKDGKNEKWEIAINSFLVECFSVEEIEEILERELRNTEKLGRYFDKEAKKYFEDNDYLFSKVKEGFNNEL